jgi:hypothetical protein
MTRRAKQSKVIHTDETRVPVQDGTTKGQCKSGRIWTYIGDESNPYVVYDNTPDRTRAGPQRFLADYKGYLQADAYGGYDGIYHKGEVTEVACWAHARRKFYDARNSDGPASAQALAYIRLLYDVEKEAKESAYAGGVDLTAERYRLRQQRSVPRLQQFHAWLTSQQAEHGGPVLPRSPIGLAIAYALNQWDALCVYTTDGDLSMDNNAAENALRRVALGRKNWLFCGSDNGGRTAAVLFSLIATCQSHRVNPFEYLRDVLTRIAATPVSQLDQLLPDQWKPA